MWRAWNGHRSHRRHLSHEFLYTMYGACENIITLFKFFVIRDGVVMERLKHEKKIFYSFRLCFLCTSSKWVRWHPWYRCPPFPRLKNWNFSATALSEVQRSQLLSAEIWISLRCAIGFKSRVLSICCAVWETWTF